MKPQLKKAIIKASHNKTFPECITEFKLIDVYNKYSNCACGKNIHINNIFKNMLNCNKIIIGSHCQKYFYDNDNNNAHISKWVDNLKIDKIKLSTKLKIKNNEIFIFNSNFKYKKIFNNIYNIELKGKKTEKQKNILTSILKNPPFYKKCIKVYYTKNILEYLKKNLGKLNILFIINGIWTNAQLK